MQKRSRYHGLLLGRAELPQEQTDLRILLGGRHPWPSWQSTRSAPGESAVHHDVLSVLLLVPAPCKHGIDCAALACLLLSPVLLRQCRWGGPGEQVREIFGQHRPFLFAQLQELIRLASAREAPQSLSILSGFPRTSCPSWPGSPPVRGAWLSTGLVPP
jgi:hypothetical protein